MQASDVRFDKEFLAVLIHSCPTSGAIETNVFGDVEMAKKFCELMHDVPMDEWDAYLVESDPLSRVKLNGEGVRYCGWRFEMDEGEEFHIHLERKIVEF